MVALIDNKSFLKFSHTKKKITGLTLSGKLFANHVVPKSVDYTNRETFSYIVLINKDTTHLDKHCCTVPAHRD